MIDTGLENKIVLITGANNPCGIGAGIAKAFISQKAKAFLHYYRAAQELPLPKISDEQPDSPGESFYRRQIAKNIDEVMTAVRDMGGEAAAYEADLSDPDKIPELFNQVEKSLGFVDILVNNAAHWEADTFIPQNKNLKNELVELWTNRPLVINAGSFDRLFAVNTRAGVLMMKEFAERHVRRGAKWGRIINISTAGAYCFPSEVTYGASKLALEGYTRSTAMELGQFGITVNAVALGPVQTGWITPELEKQLLPAIPLGRIGSPEEVADVIVFLASDQARWITGQKFFVGGGHGM